jgi:hypothetical protein
MTFRIQKLAGAPGAPACAIGSPEALRTAPKSTMIADSVNCALTAPLLPGESLSAIRTYEHGIAIAGGHFDGGQIRAVLVWTDLGLFSVQRRAA